LGRGRGIGNSHRSSCGSISRRPKHKNTGILRVCLACHLTTCRLLEKQAGVPWTRYSILVATRPTRRSHVMVRMPRVVVSLAGADLPGERVRTRAEVPGRAGVRDPVKREPQQGPTPEGGATSL
jgi:hypothetical protein